MPRVLRLILCTLSIANKNPPSQEKYHEIISFYQVSITSIRFISVHPKSGYHNKTRFSELFSLLRPDYPLFPASSLFKSHESNRGKLPRPIVTFLKLLCLRHPVRKHHAKEKPGTKRFRVSGGERGIRTLERVLAVTRFPIVRLRPTQPSLHLIHLSFLRASHSDKVYYSRFFPTVNRFFQNFSFFFLGFSERK